MHADKDGSLLNRKSENQCGLKKLLQKQIPTETADHCLQL